MSKVACPSCRSEKCVRGGLDSAEPDRTMTFKFYPCDLDYFLIQPSMKLLHGDNVEACLECGLVWTYLDNEKLSQLLEKRGIPKGQVPRRRIYAVHFLKWLAFVIISGGVSVWLATL